MGKSNCGQHTRAVGSTLRALGKETTVRANGADPQQRPPVWPRPMRKSTKKCRLGRSDARDSECARLACSLSEFPTQPEPQRSIDLSGPAGVDRRQTTRTCLRRPNHPIGLLQERDAESGLTPFGSFVHAPHALRFEGAGPGFPAPSIPESRARSLTPCFPKIGLRIRKERVHDGVVDWRAIGELARVRYRPVACERSEPVWPTGNRCT